jgi:hypothetical protein
VTTAHLPSAANNNYWPEMYVNMSLADDTRPQPYTDTPKPWLFGAVSPLDPQLFARIDDFADELLRGDLSGKYTPVEVAQQLEDWAQAAADSLGRAEAASADRQGPAFRRLAIDVRVQIGLGRFFGRKLRAGVLYALFERTGYRNAATEALRAYRSAREQWARVAQITTGVYVSDVSYGEGWFQRGHWSDRLGAIDRDIALVEQKAAAAAPPLAAPDPAAAKPAALIPEILGRPQRRAGTATHVATASFRRGQPVPVALALAAGSARPVAVRLYYRHTQQAEPWRDALMSPAADGYRVEIPGDYTDSLYPLKYYFEVREESSRPWLYPGFNATLSNQPYFLLRQT